FFSAPVCIQMGTEYYKLITCHKQVVQDLYIIIVRDSVIPFLALHRLQDICCFDLKDATAPIRIYQFSVQGCLHEGILDALKDPKLMMLHMVLWIVQLKQLPDWSLC